MQNQRHIKRKKRRNLEAHSLQAGQFKQRIVPDKKKYTRKGKSRWTPYSSKVFLKIHAT